MSESLLENNFSVELKNTLSTDSIRLDVDYAQEFREHKNGHLVKMIKLDYDDLLLILLENRIADLQKEGFFCLLPLYSPDSGCPASDQYIKQIESDDDDGCIIGDHGEVYLLLDELDLVSVYDCYSRLCEESGIAELQLPPNQLNCIHVGKLRRFFYQPEAKRLSYLVINCGFDSLSSILNILIEAGAEQIPLSLNLICECDSNHQQFSDMPLLKRFRIKSLTCRISKHLALFSESLSNLTKLSLWNQVPDIQGKSMFEKDVGFTLDYLENSDLRALKEMYFCGIANKEELSRLLDLPFIRHLEKLHITGSEYASANLPIEYLLEESIIPKWQYLKEFLLDGHYVYGDRRDLFKPYPQITFY